MVLVYHYRVKDSHFSISSASGDFEKVFDEGEAIDVLVLITAGIETVRTRRLSVERVRETDPEVIKRHLMIEEAYARDISGHFNIPLHVIDNDHGNEAVRDMVSMYQRYLD